MNMRLLGARNLKEIVPQMVDASNIHLHTVPVPNDNLYDTNCTRWFTPSELFLIISSILQMNASRVHGSGR